MNFPLLPYFLKDDVRMLVKTQAISITKYPQVHGYIMEEVSFMEDNGSLPLVVQNANTVLVSSEIKMTKNVLYCVRIYHPAIDAVGRLQAMPLYLCKCQRANTVNIQLKSLV